MKIELFFPNFNFKISSDFDIENPIRKNIIIEVRNQYNDIMFSFFLNQNINDLNVSKDVLTNQKNNNFIKFLKLKLYEFKKSNPNYGNIGLGQKYEYEGTEPLLIEDFFNFLKLEIRNSNIENILK